MITTAFTARGPCRSVGIGARSVVTAEPLIQTGVRFGRVSFANGGLIPKRAASAAAPSAVTSAPRSTPWT